MCTIVWYICFNFNTKYTTSAIKWGSLGTHLMCTTVLLNSVSIVYMLTITTICKAIILCKSTTPKNSIWELWYKSEVTT